MSKGTNVSFNMPTALWEALNAREGSPASHIITAVECYLGGQGACVLPAEVAPVDVAPIEDAKPAPVKGGKRS